MVEGMRKKVRRRIAEHNLSEKQTRNQAVREFKQSEADIIEGETYAQQHRRKPQAPKTEAERLRTYKLLSRGIPSHFYKNLNKSQS